MEHFNTLGLSFRQRKQSDVKSAYRKLAMQYHPDKAGPDGLEAMKRINIAYHAIIEQKLYDPDVPDVPHTSNKTREVVEDSTDDDEPYTDDEESYTTYRARFERGWNPTSDRTWRSQYRESPFTSSTSTKNEDPLESNDIDRLRQIRSTLRRRRVDLFPHRHDNPEHSRLLQHFNERIAAINARIAQVQAEYAAAQEAARQKWQEEMLKQEEEARKREEYARMKEETSRKHREQLRRYRKDFGEDQENLRKQQEETPKWQEEAGKLFATDTLSDS